MKVLVLVCLALMGYSYGYQLCKTPADVVLVVEDSSFMDGADVGKLQTFLADIVNYYTLGKESVAPGQFDQVAYLQYSTGNKNIFHLKDFTETNDAKSAVLRAGFTLSPFTTTGPLIAPALDFAWNDELTVGNGERSCYPTIVILVSYSSYGDINNEDANAVDPVKAKQEAEDISAAARLKDSDALVITVGIGKHRNPKLLIKLATDPSYYHDYTDWDALNEDEADIIAKQACDYKVDGIFYPCEMPRVAADVVFVVDKSDAFTTDFATDIINFMKAFLNPIPRGYKWNSDVSDDGVEIGVQAALVTYSKDADIAIPLGDAKTYEEFITRAQTALGTTCTGNCPDTCIHSALDQINNHIFGGEAKNYRSCNALHYIYVFTSKCLRCPDSDADPVPIATSLRAKNTQIFVVPLQKDPAFGFWKEPLEIADDASHLYEAQLDPASILKNYLHKQSWRSVCASLPPFACPSTTPGTTATTTAGTSASSASPPSPGPLPPAHHPKALRQ